MAIGRVGAEGATVCFPRARHLVRNAGGLSVPQNVCVGVHAKWGSCGHGCAWRRGGTQPFFLFLSLRSDGPASCVCAAIN